jgi:hypothetical protein
MTSKDLPSYAYYRSRHGRWTGAFELTITDRAALAASALAFGDRLSLLLLPLLANVLGPFRLDTTVDAESRLDAGEVVHTTRLSKWGMTLFRSFEVITLHDNGREFSMHVSMGVWPRPSTLDRISESTGQVDAAATRASYDFPWLGTRMRQTGERDGEVTRLTQETPFSRGVQVLRRVRQALRVTPSASGGDQVIPGSTRSDR